MFDPGPCVYMEKIAVGPEAADVDRPRRVRSPHNLQAVAKALGEDVDDVTAVILDRARHDDLIKECREAGARIRLIPDGDVAGAISTAWPESGANILFGIGGTPEGVIAACALKCLGGAIQGRLWPRNDDERRAAVDAGYDLSRVLTTDDLVSGDDVFFSATGITDGELLKGVRYWGDGARTQSLVMRSKSGTIRTIDSRHRWHKLMRYSSLKFDYATCERKCSSHYRPIRAGNPACQVPFTQLRSRPGRARGGAVVVDRPADRVVLLRCPHEPHVVLRLGGIPDPADHVYRCLLVSEIVAEPADVLVGVPEPVPVARLRVAVRPVRHRAARRRTAVSVAATGMQARSRR